MSIFKTKYRIRKDESDDNRWFIQKKVWYKKDWRYFKGDYPTQEKVEKRMNLGAANKVFLGSTSHCVCCGKPLIKDKYIGCGHLSKDGDSVAAHWCNQVCLRNMSFKYSQWNGMPWISDYGLIPSEELFVL